MGLLMLLIFSIDATAPREYCELYTMARKIIKIW